MGLFGDDTAGLRQRISALEERLARVEGMLDSIFAQAGVDAPEPADGGVRRINGVPVSDEVIRLAGENQPIQAIKLLREQTGLGLADAKAVVDQI